MKLLHLALRGAGRRAVRLSLDFQGLPEDGLFVAEAATEADLVDALCLALHGAVEAGRLEAGSATATFELGAERFRVDRDWKARRAQLVVTEAGGDVVLRGDWDGVGAEIERLLGFTAAQFRQVVRLPVGELAEILGSRRRGSAASSGVALHRQLCRALQATADSLGGRLDDLAEYRQVILKQATGLLAPEREEPLTLEDLAETRASLSSRGTRFESTLPTLREARAKALRLLEDARLAQSGANDSARMAARIAELERRRPEIEAMRRRLDRARSVGRLAGLVGRAEAASREARAASRQLEAAEEKARATLAESQRQRRELSRQQEREPELLLLRHEARRLEEAAARHSELDAARRLNAQAEAERRQAVAHRDGLVARLEGLAQRQAALQAVVRQAEQQARTVDPRQVAQLRHEAEESARLRDQATRMADLRESLRKESKSQQVVKLRLDELERLVEDARDVAAGRRPPDPDAALPPVAQLESDVEQARAEEMRRREVVARVRDELRGLSDALGPQAYADPKRLQAAADAAAEALARVTSEGGPGLRAAADLVACVEEAEGLRRELAQAEAEAAAAESRAAPLARATAELEESLDPALRGVEDLAAAARRARRRIEEADAQREAAEQACARLAAALEEAEAAHREAREAERGARHAAEQLRLQADAGLAEAGFRDAQELRAAALPEAETARMESEVLVWDESMRAVQAKALPGPARAVGPADLEQLEQLAALVDSAVAQEEADQSRLSERLELLDSWLSHLDGFAAEMGEFSDGGSARESSAVLPALVSESLEAASQALERLSSGRYRLEWAEAQVSGEPALDVELHEPAADVVRGASSLSPAEGFAVALALCQGVAEVVQAHAGGIQPQVVFAAGGFERLDGEALDEAAACLRSLRSGGCVVGVLGAPPALRERIGLTLDADASGGGDARASSAEGPPPGSRPPGLPLTS